MRRFLKEPLPARGRVTLEGDEAHHLARVLRARPGDTVGLFDGQGREMTCVVVEVARDRVLLRVEDEVDPPRPRRVVTLCASIPRGRRMEWMVEKSAEAGVARIVPLVAGHSARRGAGSNTRQRWQRAAVEASKQCGRADVPVVEPLTSLSDAVASVAGQAIAVAVPGQDTTLARLLDRDVERVAVFIGPEGGFSTEEMEELRGAGAREFGLGRLTLRVETAAVLAVHAAAW